MAKQATCHVRLSTHSNFPLLTKSSKSSKILLTPKSVNRPAATQTSRNPTKTRRNMPRVFSQTLHGTHTAVMSPNKPACSGLPLPLLLLSSPIITTFTSNRSVTRATNSSQCLSPNSAVSGSLLSRTAGGLLRIGYRWGCWLLRGCY